MKQSDKALLQQQIDAERKARETLPSRRDTKRHAEVLSNQVKRNGPAK